MRSWSLLSTLLALFTSGLLLPGCPSDSDSDDDDSSAADDDDDTGDDDDTTGDDDDDDAIGDPTSVADICATVFECFANDWGWSSEQECTKLWLTGCADENAYLVCAEACITGDCAEFALEDGTGGCEPDCWSAHCM